MPGVVSDMSASFTEFGSDADSGDGTLPDLDLGSSRLRARGTGAIRAGAGSSSLPKSLPRSPRFFADGVFKGRRSRLRKLDCGLRVFFGEQLDDETLELGRAERLGEKAVRLELLECLFAVLLAQVDASDDHDLGPLQLAIRLDLFAQVEPGQAGQERIQDDDVRLFPVHRRKYIVRIGYGVQLAPERVESLLERRQVIGIVVDDEDGGFCFSHERSRLPNGRNAKIVLRAPGVHLPENGSLWYNA